MILHVTVTNGHMTRPSVTHMSHNIMEDSRRFWKECHIMCITHINLKVDTWSYMVIRVG